MPLLNGSSRAVVSENIREMRNAGHPENVAVAAALRNADKAKSSGRTRTIKPKKAGQKPLHFQAGGLHSSTGTAAGQKISASKHAEAASGKLGSKAKKQEQFYQNVLKK